MHRNSRALAVLAAVALAIGCQTTSPTRTTRKIVSPTPSQLPASGASTAPVPVEANVGRLVGQLLGPRTGLVSNNAASVLANHGAGLVSNNAASYAVLGATESSGPVAGAEVTVVDELGTVVSEAAVKTDAQGRFTFPRLKDSGPLVFIQATYSEAGRTIVLIAAAAAPRTLGDQNIQVDAASTLVARKVRVLLGQKAIQSAELRTTALAAMATQLGAAMTEKAVVAAAILDAPLGAAAFDAMLAASPALQQRLSAGTSGALAAVVVPAPQPSVTPTPVTSPVPSASETPRPRASKTPKPSPTPTPTPVPSANLGAVSGFVGSLTSGSADGSGADAAFLGPDSVVIAADGTMYVGEKQSHRIRRVTPAGVVMTIAGSGSAGYFEGKGTQAYFNTPEDLALDGTGRLYVADSLNHVIRMIDLNDPTFPVTTFAGRGTPGFLEGLGRAAAFDLPAGLAVAADGSVYVSDYDNDRIRRISPAGLVSTVAGDGVRATVNGALGSARFNGPDGLCVDKDGHVYIAEYDGHTIRKIATTGIVSTIAGDGIAGYLDGPGATARFNEPTDVAVDAKGRLYVTDFSNHRIRRILANDTTRPVDTLAGSGVAGWSDGLGIGASLSFPASLAIRAPQTLFVTDMGNHMVRRVE